jgi:WD40 repeat protein
MLLKRRNLKWAVVVGTVSCCVITLGIGFLAADKLCPLTGNKYIAPPDIVPPEEPITIDNIQNLRLIAEVQREDYWSNLLFFSDDGSILGYSTQSGIVLWDVSTGKRTGFYQQVIDGICGWNSDNPFTWVSDAAISANGSSLASDQGEQRYNGTDAPTLRLWNIENHKLLHMIEKGFLIGLVSPSAGEDWLLYATRPELDTYVVHVLDLKQNREIRTFEPSAYHMSSTLVPEANIILFRLETGIEVINLGTGQQKAVIPLEASTDDAWTNQFAISPDGSTLVSWNNFTHILTLWDVVEAAQMNSLTVSDKSATSIDAVKISPDNRWAVLNFYPGSTASDAKLLFWNLETGAAQVESANTQPAVDGTFTFTPDSKLVAFGDRDGAIRVWDVEAAQELTILNVAPKIEMGAYPLFSPDGRLLAVISRGEILLWGISKQ